MTIDISSITLENLWEVIQEYQGKTFYTKKGLPFTYMIKGGEMFTDRRERSITRSTFETAYHKLEQNVKDPEHTKAITGPKSLNVYGAPYVWAIFTGIGILNS